MESLLEPFGIDIHVLREKIDADADETTRAAQLRELEESALDGALMQMVATLPADTQEEVTALIEQRDHEGAMRIFSGISGFKESFQGLLQKEIDEEF